MINEQDLKIIERDCGSQVFTFNSTDYVCSPSVTTMTSEYGIGGEDLKQGLILLVRNSILPSTKPKKGNKLTYKSKIYRINNVHEDQLGVALRLYCEEEDRGI